MMVGLIGLMAIPKLASFAREGGVWRWRSLLRPMRRASSMGHVHWIVADLEAATKFWVTLGGEASPCGPLARMKFPGDAGAAEARRADRSAPAAAGSVVDHVCFQVPNLAKALAVWQAAGLKDRAGPHRGAGLHVITPDDLLLRTSRSPKFRR